MTRNHANLDVARQGARPFRDRGEAGRSLAQMLGHLRDDAPVVLAVSGGAVPVALEVASALGADLDVLLVQPIRRPNGGGTHGLLVEGGAVLTDPDRSGFRPRPDEIDQAIAAARRELKLRATRYRAGRPQTYVAGRTVILVDDGMLTGRTMRAAIAARRHLRPGRLVIAVPVAPTLVVHALRRDVDAVVCAALDPSLTAIANAYDDFHPLAESEILGALARGRADLNAQASVVVADVTVDVPGAPVEATLTLPRAAAGIVVVPCVDAGERHRARALVRSLADENLGFLLLDWAGGPARFRDAFARMLLATWNAGLPLGVLSIGTASQPLVTAISEDGCSPTFCLVDEAKATEVALYFGARFGRGLMSV